VINLLLGLFDPSSGTITMAGRDTRADIRAWWRHIGYVPQSIYLFDDSLRRNIAIGVEDSEIDEAALERAIKMAALGPMVGSLPQGVNSVIGEDGARISGGERQRIGIARALYRDPDVLVFDEATSALDNDTEKFIMQSIDGLRDRKTIVFIAHRLSTVRQCDRLFLMDNGVLADSGDYETLASRNAAFRRLAALEPAGPAS
jgi:ATP-binding cassette subfamily C protein